MISELLMSTGGWSLEMRADTPREKLAKILPFSHIGIAASRLNTARPDAELLAACRYVGVVTSPGPSTSIGGYGLAMWLEGPGGQCYSQTGASLPSGTIAFSGTDISFWANDIISSTGLSVGSTKVVSLAGGPFGWDSTPRQVLDWVADATGTEWRITTAGKLDIDDYTALYGTTPEVIVSRRSPGRDIEYTSVDGAVTSTVDVEDYASRVTVLGGAGLGTSGGSSPYYGFGATAPLLVWRVVSAQDAALGSEAAVAASVLGRYSTPRRDITLTTEQYDVSGEITVGAPVWASDPELGIYDLTSTPILHRGEWIMPLALRVTGTTWPVVEGMGVYCRVRDTVASAWEWVDLTDHVVFEAGSTELKLGANRRWSER